MLISFSLIWARSFSLMYTNKLSKGELKKRPHDQHVRKCVTREHLIDLEMIAIISPLHAELRAFDFYLYIIYHLSAGVFQWSQEKGVLGEDQFNLLQESKARV